MIDRIIKHFDEKKIGPFFNLNEYDTDFEISRHVFKMLNIGYIKKEDINNPKLSIYVVFKKKCFSIEKPSKIFNYIIFTDEYNNYNSTDEVYKKVKLICDNINDYEKDIKIFEKLDKMIKKHSKINFFKDSDKAWKSFKEIYEYICDLDEKGKLEIIKRDCSISHLMEIIINDGPEYFATVTFKPLNINNKYYKIGVCVRGEPLVKIISKKQATR